jgi:hypothetical protein
LLGTSACGDDDAPIDPGTSRLRVIHLSPDAPAVDVWVNGGLEAVSDLSFEEGTPYLELESGSYDFDVSPAGGSASDSVLAVDGVTLEDGLSYTVVAFDELGEIQALLLEDSTAGLAPGTIRVRAIHTALQVGEVDIWLLPTSGSPTSLYENLGFGDVGEYLEVPAEAFTLGFDANDDGTPDLIFDVPALPEGTVANVFAVSDESGAVYLLAQLQNGTIAKISPRPALGEARIRAIHLSPDAPEVDIWVGTESEVVGDLGFGEGTDYLTVEEGTYTFNVTAAGQSPTSPVLSFENVSLEAGRSYTAVAFDEVASIQGLTLVDDYANLAAGNIRVRAIHAAAAVGEVDIWLLPGEGSPTPLYENVALGDAGGALDIPAEAFTIGFDLDNDAFPELVFEIPALPAGTVANVFALNDDQGSVFLLAQTNDGTVTRIEPLAQPRIRVIHLSPDAPAVDVYVGTESKVVSGLAFEEGTGYLEVEPGIYTFNVTAEGGNPSSPVLSFTGVPLFPGRSYTAVAFDEVASIQGLPLVDDYSELASGDIRVRAIHAAYEVGDVDIWLLGATPSILYSELGFGEVGGYLDIPSAAFSIGFDVDGDQSPDLTFDIPQLTAGTVANVFAVNDDLGAVFLLAQINDGTVVRIDAN